MSVVVDKAVKRKESNMCKGKPRLQWHGDGKDVYVMWRGMDGIEGKRSDMSGCNSTLGIWEVDRSMEEC